MLKKEANTNTDLIGNTYYYIASIIEMIENGIMGIKYCYTLDNNLIPALRIEDLAMIPYIKNLAMYIKALSEIENRNYSALFFIEPGASNASRISEIMMDFFKQCLEDKNFEDYSKEELQELKRIIENDKEKIMEIAEDLYSTDLKFATWDVESITYLEDEQLRKYQTDLKQSAKKIRF